ncbi:MAG: B12-binding domain-containing radical SAM protein [Candidatus Schekmanbacteria bacterium]|nr:B12-binding domain-containing radical SAM protein [Candidatus Schekmanbacteria bacterium]
MKLLLVLPSWPAGSFWAVSRDKFPSLGLLTVAGLTPREHDVHFADEQLGPIPSDLWYGSWDLVGIGGLTAQSPRAYAIAEHYRGRGIPVVMGGPHASALPAEALQHCDAVVTGEAEGVWDRVLSDTAEGKLNGVYNAGFRPELAGMPMPRRDLLADNAYVTKSIVITTRGCPFECEFCVVTSLFGGAFRRRPIEEVVAELEAIRDRHKFMFFADDNFIAHKGHAKAMMKAFARLNIAWSTQSTINIAKDEELLKLAADSNCWGLFIGFESLNEETLRRMGKTFVKLETYKESIKKIHSYGIGIQGSFVFGSDGDDKGVFERTLRFVEEVRLEAVMLSVLTPFPGTETHHRLKREGRIYHEDWSRYDMNTVVYRPNGMTERELQDGLMWLGKRFYSVPSMFRRLPAWRQNRFLWIPQNYFFARAYRDMRHPIPPAGEPAGDRIHTPSPAEVRNMGGYLHPITARQLELEAGVRS